MSVPDANVLRTKQCLPCEGGIPKYTKHQVTDQLKELPDWKLSEEGNKISRHWVFQEFESAFHFLSTVAKLAEQEQHHPDLHLVRYRFVQIELYTHAVNGLSENDFILAAKIDAATSDD
jgi:4a-hydroxytetrahydrobiopterin dehydratase